jgi:hypothetical protein
MVSYRKETEGQSMREEWKYILPMTGMALVAGTWQSVETTLNLRSAGLDPKPVGMRHELREPFLPEGHEEGKRIPPPKMFVTMATSTAVNSAYSFPQGVMIEELHGDYRVRVPWEWPPKG